MRPLSSRVADTNQAVTVTQKLVRVVDAPIAGGNEHLDERPWCHARRVDRQRRR